jgi:hypothetical protein
MLLVETGTKGLGEIQIEEIIVPLTPTTHAMRVSGRGKKILFNTVYTALILTVWTAQLFPKLYCKF